MYLGRCGHPTALLKPADLRADENASPGCYPARCPLQCLPPSYTRDLNHIDGAPEWSNTWTDYVTNSYTPSLFAMVDTMSVLCGVMRGQWDDPTL